MTGWALVAIIDVLIVGAGVVVFVASAMFGVFAYRGMQAVSAGVSVTDADRGGARALIGVGASQYDVASARGGGLGRRVLPRIKT